MLVREWLLELPIDSEYFNGHQLDCSVQNRTQSTNVLKPKPVVSPFRHF